METKLGPLLRKLRKEKGLTLKEVGNLTGISFPQVGKIERELHKPSRDTILKLASALSQNEEELLYLAGYKVSEDTHNINIMGSLRYETLTTYNSTCQLCGVKAPNKQVDVTFIDPQKMKIINENQFEIFPQKKMDQIENFEIITFTQKDLTVLCLSCLKSRESFLEAKENN